MDQLEMNKRRYKGHEIGLSILDVDTEKLKKYSVMFDSINKEIKALKYIAIEINRHYNLLKSGNAGEPLLDDIKIEGFRLTKTSQIEFLKNIIEERTHDVIKEYWDLVRLMRDEFWVE